METSHQQPYGNDAEMSTNAMLSANQLARRREGAVRQLLYRYQEEYVELLKLLKSRCPVWSKRTPATEMPIEQKSVSTEKFEEFLKERLEMQDIEEAELLELRSFGVPIVSKKRLRDPSRVPPFGETEAFLAAALTQTATASQSEPDVGASSSVPSEQQDQPSDSSADLPMSDNSEKAETEVVRGLERLETFACSACYRAMERDDDLICLIGHQGKYAVRRNAFTIGCIVPPMAAIHREAATEPPSHIGRKRKAVGEPTREQRDSKDVDVDLGLEGKQCNETCLFAHVWVKHNGLLCIRPVGQRDIWIDGNELKPGYVAFLKHWSLLEIEGVPLMVLVNQNAIHRLRKRSKHEINI